MVSFLAAAGALLPTGAGTGLSEEAGEGVTAGAGESCESFTWMIGDENWKLLAVR